MLADVTADARGNPMHGSDRNLYVEFYTKALQNNNESQKQGRPVFFDVDYVKILIPGDKNTSVERKATDADRQRFPYQWAQYQAKQGQGVQGTPLKQWPAVSVSQIEEWAYHKVYTVEQLAGLSDTQIQHIGLGGREWSEKAKTYLAAAKDSSIAPALAAENERLKADLARTQATVDTLAARLDALEAPKGKKAA